MLLVRRTRQRFKARSDVRQVPYATKGFPGWKSVKAALNDCCDGFLYRWAEDSGERRVLNDLGPLLRVTVARQQLKVREQEQ